MVLIDVAGGLPSVKSVTPNSSVLCQRQASFIQLNSGIFICIIDVNLQIILQHARSSKEACFEFRGQVDCPKYLPRFDVTM